MSATRIAIASLVGTLLLTAGIVALTRTDEAERPWRGPIVPAAKASPVALMPRWIAATSRATDISPVAMRAYARATLRLKDEQPECRLGWTTLAGIGWIETRNGRYGGAHLRADGVTSERILGPALNGRNGTRAIPSTKESRRWHGNVRWDHAVGPMQFIPSTWAIWGTDADRDGSVNPNDIDDAALAAARYLCEGDRDLRTDRGWSEAVHTYNNSERYMRNVLSVADNYAKLASPT